jgi:hypothetical protein
VSFPEEWQFRMMVTVRTREKFTVQVGMFRVGQMSAVNDQCCRQPLSVTCVDVKDQVSEYIQNKQRISIDEHI